MALKDAYYTASEARAKLGLSHAMFFRKVKEGLIPKVVPPGMKQGVYPKRDVDALALSLQAVFELHEKVVFSRSSPADQVEEIEIGRRFYGHDFITPLAERMQFQQKAEFSFHSLKVNGHVVGYVTLFRFLPAFLEDLLSGRKIERDIGVKDVQPFTRLEPFSIYIDAFVVDPNLPAHEQDYYKSLLTVHTLDLILTLLANNYQITHLYTVSSNRQSDEQLHKLGFRPLPGKSLVPARTAYELALNEDTIALLRAMSQRI